LKITTPFFNDYLNKQSDLLNKIDQKDLLLASNMISKIGKNKLILVGNGGSASICSHMATDFAKVHNIRSLSFSSDSFLTCFANDYGYENWSKNALNIFCDKKDIVILISSSGSSKNILLAADFCKKKSIKFITMSGFNKNNELNSYGNINFWVNSKMYNHIEMTHHIILTSICDYL
jgi:D-sedoheptulose 7-phosphate isomerase